MKSDPFIDSSSVALLATGILALFLPLGSLFNWTLFGLVLLTASLVSYLSFAPRKACMTIGALLCMAGGAATMKIGLRGEALSLLLSGLALVIASFVVAKVKVKKMISKVTQTSNVLPSRPSIGEIIAESQKLEKSKLTVPRYVQPVWQKDFKQIIGMDDFKKTLYAAGRESMSPDLDRNGILLHGEPGNGKTAFAKALAGELGLEFIAIEKVMSKWVGEESVSIFNQLNEAINRSPCLIFIDEADSILGARSDSSRSSHLSETNAIVNRLLTYLVDYRTCGVVFVAATNFIDQIDPAIRRPGRFDFVLEVPNPDEQARAGLLYKGLERHAPTVKVQKGIIESLAKRWNGFSTATLLGVPAIAPQYLKDNPKNELDFDDFMSMLRRQQGISNRVPETTKSFSDMAYPEEQGRAIKNLISRMDRSYEIEQSGGTAPSGALFYGDPGTGKSETARMIAKETKWAFFPVSGADLARDPDQLDKLLTKVRNARPAIIFIDEADDLLGDRANSQYKLATNKLLAAMDGPLGRMNDLLWIAATNFAEASDSAVVRSGRFTEKVKFHKPGDGPLLNFAKEFFTDPKRNAVMLVSWAKVGEVLHGCSIADAQGILMQAWNLTLTANGGVDRTNPVTLEVLVAARNMIELT